MEEDTRSYYERNKERLKKAGREYHYKNREKHLAYSKEYYAKNKDKLNAKRNAKNAADAKRKPGRPPKRLRAHLVVENKEPVLEERRQDYETIKSQPLVYVEPEPARIVFYHKPEDFTIRFD